MQTFAPSLAPPAEILIVDDAPLNLHLFAEILSLSGYLVRAAINGAFALKSAQLRPPHLILLDIMMPDLTGFEVCAQLKADERTRHIPIIFVSAMDDTTTQAQALAAGGVDFLSKPVEAQDLLNRVATWLPAQDSPSPSQAS